MMPREKWTDDRLDQFDKKIDDGFAQVDRRFDEVHKKMDDGFTRVDTEIHELRGETNQRFDKVDGKMESGFAELRGEMNSLKKSLFAASVSVIVALIACGAALVGVAITVN